MLTSESFEEASLSRTSASCLGVFAVWTHSLISVKKLNTVELGGGEC